MQGILREYMGTTELDRRVLDLQPTSTLQTIGRSETCTYTIGKSLGKLALGISKVQATLILQDECMMLRDGGADGVSANGIYCHTEKIDGAIALVPGLELTLFKHGLAKVELRINDLAALEHGNDTYTGQDLLSIMQEQVLAFGGQIAALQLQIAQLGDQITQREAIDTQQERRLVIAERRLNRVVFVMLSAIALIVLAGGWLGGAAVDKKELTSTATSIVIALAALYFKAQETKDTKATP